MIDRSREEGENRSCQPKPSNAGQRYGRIEQALRKAGEGASRAGACALWKGGRSSGNRQRSMSRDKPGALIQRSTTPRPFRRVRSTAAQPLHARVPLIQNAKIQAAENRS